ncbi:hypothetical protein [Chamaesiphon minutus]|uniref:PAP_fibrillin n=1 Tax=Chamaesiphon minutus (strain ATCC 27169 / PCC 6605) TaxID=1173020 RepID=K9UL70_CHAP6|nr:hypothetical protein [Chamaesiphon minutus]AFY95827.1 hypothetical protein Cha6605_4918 [Chamaesiphon minutus PCC 6605]
MNTITPDFVNILERAAQSKARPSTAEMVEALQQAEIATKKAKLAIPFASLIGEWRLCFATGASKDKKRGGIKLGRGYYLPKFTPASITFTRETDSSIEGTITNQLLVGSIHIQFTGPCRYPGKKNLLAFDFTEIQIKVFGTTVYQGKIRSGKIGSRDFARLSVANLPFFGFFWASESGIAARGRGGGLALWVKDEVVS